MLFATTRKKNKNTTNILNRIVTASMPPRGITRNKNNRGQKYPLQGVTGFNQLVIKLQLIFDIAFCDYEEEK